LCFKVAGQRTFIEGGFIGSFFLADGVNSGTQNDIFTKSPVISFVRVDLLTIE